MNISGNGYLEGQDSEPYVCRNFEPLSSPAMDELKLLVCADGTQFQAKVLELQTAEKTGAVFKIASEKLSGDDKCEVEVWRSFKEFMWLDYQIRAYHHKEHRIFPPLPVSGKSKSRQSAVHGVSSKIIDDTSLDCQVLTQYLATLCLHPRFGSSEFLHSFLTSPDPISLPAHMPTSLPTRCTYKLPSTSNVTDQFFIKECTFVSAYEPAINNASSVMKKLVFKTTDFAEVWAANSILMQSSADSSLFNKYLTLFAEVAHDLQFHSISQRDSEEMSLGVTLSFNAILLNEEKRLLELWHQLVCKCCNLRASLSKHPHNTPKHKQVQEDLVGSESELNRVGEECKEEISHYKQQRDRSLRQSILSFAEKQLSIAQQLETSLRTCLIKLKDA
ncbi:uncharacterized protein LOC142350234 [Convolutriloba macropyga]|uniref:uncharacterized protein LOC142350234 n=1 Tax=Convolutriloba macropyga TaxID=536237 RepID=UPI003F5215F2